MLRSTGSALDFDPTFAVLTLNSDHRSKRARLPCQIASFALAAALVLACAPHRDPGGDDTTANFTDVVDFQAHHLTTDLISVPEGLGMATVDHGWQRQDDAASGESWLGVTGKLGRLSIFSADGDLEELELELSLGNTGAKQRSAVHVLLNDNRLDRLHPTAEWSSYSVRVPSEWVRRGVNILELVPRWGSRPDAETRGPQIRLRRVRLRSRSGRLVWPARPQAIQSGEGIEMPVSSYIDLALRVPPDGRLVGSYEAVIAKPDSVPVWAYIQLLDETGKERTLLNKHLLKTIRRAQEVDLDLSRWAGELVRLRVGTTGPGNGVVRWRDLRVTASRPIERPTPLPPITRSDTTKSGRLGQPDVLVILLDAARADSFSTFGGPHPTPATERLAAGGTAFEQAMAPAPWTSQSVPSILTGLFPDTLGVGPWGSRLTKTVPTLAELMAGAGYRTVLWSQHPFYSNHDSFRRGFQEFYRNPQGNYQVLPAAETLMTEDRPTFAFVHLIPPHAPYEPPAPFLGAYSRWYSGNMSVDAQSLNSFTRHQDSQTLPESDRRYAHDRYLENVAFADDLVGQILATLESNGRYDDTMIVLLSDHGEAFLEHGIFLHTRNLHTELLHVPFVIKWPAQQQGFAARIPSPVSLVDLVPTLVDGLGLEGADEGFQGTSLLPPVFDGASEARTLYAVTRGVEDRRKAPKPAVMLQAGDWRILHDPLHGSSKLYNHTDDPGETLDLSSDQYLQALLLRQGLLSQQHSNRELLGGLAGEEMAEEIDPEVIEQLETLGYLN